MNWIKKNLFSIAAVVISIIALIRVEPFVLGDDSIQWIITICISILTLAITIALGSQIWSAMTIEKRIKNSVEKAKEDVRKEIDFEISDCRAMSLAVFGFLTARISHLNKDFDDAFICYTRNIPFSKNAGLNDFPDMSLAELEGIMLSVKESRVKLSLSNKVRNELIKILSSVDDERAIQLIKFISSLS